VGPGLPPMLPRVDTSKELDAMVSDETVLRPAVLRGVQAFRPVAAYTLMSASLTSLMSR
jgi:hypothetical protein